MMKKPFFIFALFLILVFAGCVSQNQQTGTTTTVLVSRLNESQLIERYLDKNTFCINDSDCELRCGGNKPIICENEYFRANNRGKLGCFMELAFAKNALPMCLCNTSINECYLIVEFRNITTTTTVEETTITTTPTTIAKTTISSTTTTHVSASDNVPDDYSLGDINPTYKSCSSDANCTSYCGYLFQKEDRKFGAGECVNPAYDFYSQPKLENAPLCEQDTKINCYSCSCFFGLCYSRKESDYC